MLTEKSLLHIFQGEKSVSEISSLKQFVESVFNSSNIAMLLFDSEGICRTANNNFCSFVEYPKGKLVDQSIFKLFPNDFNKKNFALIKGFIEKQEILKLKTKIITSNGKEKYIHATIFKAFEDNEKLWAITIKDITNRLENHLIKSVLLKISEEAGYSSSVEEMYSAIRNSIGLIMPAENLLLIQFDEENFSLKSRYVTGVFKSIVNKPEFNKFFKTIAIQMQSKNKAFLINHELISSLSLNEYSSKIYFSHNDTIVAPLKVKEKIIGLMLIKSSLPSFSFNINDKKVIEIISSHIARVIERKNFEEEIILIQKKAETASKIKSEFLAQMSHEIRTPLNSIMSFSNLLKSEIGKMIGNKYEAYFSSIEHGTSRLVRTMDLLLSASQVHSGSYKVSLSELDMEKDVIVPILDKFSNIAHSKGIELTYKNISVNSRLICDNYSVNQIFINLLDNAIKFTNSGEVKVIIKDNEKKQLQIDVEDTGVGISEKYLPEVFELFSQEETGYTRKFEGMGLGLVLVKEYATLNKADVQIVSKKNKGTTFSVIFW
ncbi:MAG: PAS domain-containing sensor histidine kinase [Ignavibacteria bacterium]|jgi:PAS domain S-box-containing protein